MARPGDLTPGPALLSLAGLALGAHALKILRSQRPLGGPGTPVLTDPAHDEPLFGSEAGQVDSGDLLEAFEVRVVGGQVELEDAIALFEEGLQLVNSCDSQLKNFENRVQELLNTYQEGSDNV